MQGIPNQIVAKQNHAYCKLHQSDAVSTIHAVLIIFVSMMNFSSLGVLAGLGRAGKRRRIWRPLDIWNWQQGNQKSTNENAVCILGFYTGSHHSKRMTNRKRGRQLG